MAVTIMAIAFAVIVGGMATAVLSSDLQRRQAKADVALRDAAESLVYTCGTYALPRPPDGFTLTIEHVSYLNSEGTQYVTGPAPATCADSPPLQLVDLKIESTNGRPVTRSLQVVVRP
ncbi:MAG TPA: hypothetical protein VFJ85_11515 [Acidimicrobiales bacterium]|nr:hypothetical protein [Acidimicrobiales bacterium]